MSKSGRQRLLDYHQYMFHYKNMKTSCLKCPNSSLFAVLMRLIVFLAVCLALCACGTSGERVQTQPFTVNMNSPHIPIGEVEFQLESLMGFGGIRKYTANVFYFPREDAVALQYRHEFLTYHLFFSREGRIAYLNALAQYNQDYNDRELDRRARRTIKKYGSVEGFLTWQISNLTILARANMTIDYGYSFKDRAPYFTITQGMADFIDPESRSNNRTSTVITMFSTRAQAAQLAELFDPVSLRELFVPAVDNQPDIDLYDEVDIDIYDDE